MRAGSRNLFTVARRPLQKKLGQVRGCPSYQIKNAGGNQPNPLLLIVLPVYPSQEHVPFAAKAPRLDSKHRDPSRSRAIDIDIELSPWESTLPATTLPGPKLASWSNEAHRPPAKGRDWDAAAAVWGAQDWGEGLAGVAPARETDLDQPARHAPARRPRRAARASATPARSDPRHAP